jgi:EF-P beta-lysylation protein EpmB
LLRLGPELARAAEQPAAEFPMLVPRPYAQRIRPADPDDPLLRQVLPRAEELAFAPGFSADPLGEAAAGCCPGLLRKYYGRSLILATGACAVHCRFCFRRHFLRGANCELERHVTSPLAGALDLLAADTSVSEVILSGGDPLCIPDLQIAALVSRLESIPHLRRMRIHTRMPIALPQRVTGELVALLQGARLRTLVVVHVNHPAEIDREVEAAIDRFIDAGIPVLSQTVLLRGVNDNIEALAGLYELLADLRVAAYYLHQLDRVSGTAHFEVPIDLGVKLVAQLRARLPGYAVPRYVREVPGATSKQLLA